MPRIARVVLPGVPHHVTQRGGRRQQVFFGPDDYSLYLGLLASHSRLTGTQVLAYCQMPNHVHLVLVPRDAGGLAALLGPVHSTYARLVNHRKGWMGHLWQERFYSVALDEKHLHACVRYVLQNPVRAEFVSDVLAWPHSSAASLLEGRQDPVVTREPLASLRSDWPDFLREALPRQEAERLRFHTRTGRALATASRPGACVA